ncbi:MULTISPECIES: hypothetical protein [unclassified Flavobacterium]|nr:MULTISPECIES: hypothetical protein [unclassified Flavobacterium]
MPPALAGGYMKIICVALAKTHILAKADFEGNHNFIQLKLDAIK